MNYSEFRRLTASAIALAFIQAGFSGTAQAFQPEDGVRVYKIKCEDLFNPQDSQPKTLFSGLPVTIIAIAVKSGVSMLFDSAQSRVERKLKAYQSSVSYRLNLESIPASGCVTLTRDDGKMKFAFDIVEVNTSQNFDSFYFHHFMGELSSAPKGVRGETFGFSIGAKATTYSPLGSPRVSVNETETLVKGAYGEKPYKKEPTKIPTKTDSETKIVSLDPDRTKPWFHIPKIGNHSTPVTIEFSITEVGEDADKKRLKFWKKFLGKSKDDLTTTFSDAIIELIKSEENTDG